MAAPALAGVEALREARADLEKLQGVWGSVSGRRPAELLVAGRLYAIKFLDGEVYVGGFDLDADESPRRMVMRIEEGPARHRGRVAHCLYELEGDMLCWCASEPGAEELLTAFPCADERRYLSLVFRRQRTQAKHLLSHPGLGVPVKGT
jgi:uncharacterized protein (TIGR03067 family)